jgi:hypothetical protein
MKTPVVTKQNGRFSVQIHPGCHLQWWTEPRHEGLILVVEADCPTLRRYGNVDVPDHLEVAIKDLPQ